MSDEQPENVPPVVSPVLRREALLPGERSRGLGTVAVVCTMAGVASGLALATTLMAMQVADGMSLRGYQLREVRVVQPAPQRDHGFLGVLYVPRDGYADVSRVLPGYPAAAAGLRPGDHILSIDDVRITADDEFKSHVFDARPGTSPTLVVERDGEHLVFRPTLVAWPTVSASN